MRKLSLRLQMTSVIGLWYAQICFADIVNGGLQNMGNASPATIILNLVHVGMNATLASISSYTAQHHQCPPANYFLQRSDNGLVIYNGSKCDVIAYFGANVPGVLKNKTIRTVIKYSSTYPNPADFAFRQTITNIDYGSNGYDPSFLLNQPPPYTWSHTLQASYFGNAASAPLQNVLYDNYDTIAKHSSAANSTSSSSDSGANDSKTTTIKSV